MAQYHFSDFGGAVGLALCDNGRATNVADDECSRPVRRELARAMHTEADFSFGGSFDERYKSKTLAH